MKSFESLMERLKRYVTKDDSYVRRFRCLVSGHDIIDAVSHYGVIAGGSVVYSLTITQSISDIDVFILDGNIGALHEIVNLLVGYYTIVDYRTYGSLVELETSNGLVWQIILTNYNTVNSLLAKFDMDYVKCGYYRGTLTVLPEARIAHKSKTISIVATRIKSYRLQKAMSKGFRCSPQLLALASPVEPVVKDFQHVTLRELLAMTFKPLTLGDYEHIDINNCTWSLSWKQLPDRPSFSVSVADTIIKSGNACAKLDDTLCYVRPMKKVPNLKEDGERWICQIQDNEITSTLVKGDVIFMNLPEEVPKGVWQWMIVGWQRTYIRGTEHCSTKPRYKGGNPQTPYYGDIRAQ
jgi:hypothetical protein